METKILESIVIDLLYENIKDWQSGFRTKNDEFYSAESTELEEKQDELPLTENSHLILRYIPRCEFEYNSVDESSVGLGGVGDVSGIENSWFEIVGLFYCAPNGEEYDLHDAWDLKHKIEQEINIE